MACHSQCGNASLGVSVDRQLSIGELLAHKGSSENIVQQVDNPGPNADTAKVNISIKGTAMSIRAFPPRLQKMLESKTELLDESKLGLEQPPSKRFRSEISSHPLSALVDESTREFDVVEIGTFKIPRLLPAASIPKQTLRISAGRAAAAAGIHPFTDVGDLFLEFVYQDLPDLLLRDAAIVGAEVVSPVAERARLMAKSGEMEALDSALRDAAGAVWVDVAQEAQRRISDTVAKAEADGKLLAEEASELKRVLQLEINLDFGERYEDNAIEAYEKLVNAKVFGQQRRVSLCLPAGGPAEALMSTVPPLRMDTLPQDDEFKADAPGVYEIVDEGGACVTHDLSLVCQPMSTLPKGRHVNIVEVRILDDGDHVRGRVEEPQGWISLVKRSTGYRWAKKAKKDESPAHFLITGFVDGLVDLPRISAVPGETADLETLIVEVKHRMGKIKEPPNIYDIVQACCYCRVFGLARAHLVQCLRQPTCGVEDPVASVGQLHVSKLDFSAGSPDRKGWDDHVLPSLYKIADAVYAARADDKVRLRLLSANTPEERRDIVGELCPHLGR